MPIPSSYASEPGTGLVHPLMQPAAGDPPAGWPGVEVGVAGGIGIDELSGEALGGKSVAVAGGLDTAVGRMVTRGGCVGGKVVIATGSS